MRKLVSSGSPYEPKVGISRAVRAGPIVTVAGTAPLGPDGRTVGWGDPAAQARRCLEIIAAALEGAGACFIDPDWLLEIEADAVVDEPLPG
jgi:enamine deaminase RidA (YjgF/YER057c/UK114 family)